DIERATNIARDMVTLYGMSDLGPIKYDSGNENVFLGRDYNSPSNVSGQVAFEIDQEVRKIVNSCQDLARKIIEEHKEELVRIAEALMEYETLTSEQIERVIRGESIEADFRDQHKAEMPIEMPEEKPEGKPAETADTAVNEEEKPEKEAGE
ncbi:MAG: cell division protein FtsH, partial [Solobacterium sp.]|nr:cell division protein FtsH [Solobacterium sp.]